MAKCRTYPRALLNHQGMSCRLVSHALDSHQFNLRRENHNTDPGFSPWFCHESCCKTRMRFLGFRFLRFLVRPRLRQHAATPRLERVGVHLGIAGTLSKSRTESSRRRFETAPCSARLIVRLMICPDDVLRPRVSSIRRRSRRWARFPSPLASVEPGLMPLPMKRIAAFRPVSVGLSRSVFRPIKRPGAMPWSSDPLSRRQHLHDTGPQIFVLVSHLGLGISPKIGQILDQ